MEKDMDKPEDQHENSQALLQNNVAKLPGRLWPQIFAILVVNLLSLSAGFVLSFTGAVFDQLRNDTSINPTTEECSWIASFPALSSFFGAICGSIFVDRLGRKKCLIACGIFDVAGWFCVSFSADVTTIYIGRALNGIALGLSCSLVYISEVSTSQLKEILTSSIILAVNTGCVVVAILGSFINWRTVAGIGASLPMAFLLLIFFQPESPSWLLTKGRDNAAKKALTKLRGNLYDVDGELKVIEKRQKEINALRSNIWSKATSPAALRPFFLMFVLFSLKEFCGSMVILNYAIDIFREVLGETMNPKIIVILITSERVVFLIFATLLLKFVRVRPMLFGSAVLTAICLLAIAILLSVPSGDNTTVVNWVILVSFLLSTATYVGGLGVLPWVLMGQMFPLSVRGLFSCAMSCVSSAMSFIVIKTFSYIVKSWGMNGAFFLYGGSAVVSCIYIYFFIPETKGKTLQEIEDSFDKKRRRKSEQPEETNSV